MPHHVKDAADERQAKADRGILQVTKAGCGHLILAAEAIANEDEQGMRFTVCPECDAKLKTRAELRLPGKPPIPR